MGAGGRPLWLVDDCCHAPRDDQGGDQILAPYPAVEPAVRLSEDRPLCPPPAIASNESYLSAIHAVAVTKALRGVAATLGGRAKLCVARPQPTSRQGLRANHCLGNRMDLLCIRPALQASLRNGLKLPPIVWNCTLKEIIQFGRQRFGN